MYNPLNYGCKGDGVTDDRACLQLTFNAIDLQQKAIVTIPAGKRFRSTDYLHAQVNNLTVNGGGELYFDPGSVGGHLAFTKYQSNMYAAGLIVSANTCNLATPTDPNDARTSRRSGSPLSSVTIDSVSITSTGTYPGLVWNGQGEPETNIPLNHNGLLIWCADNVTVNNTTFSGFYTDALEVWGLSGLSVTGNTFQNIGFNGIGALYTQDATVSGNTFSHVGQAIEAGPLRWSVMTNNISEIAMRGILLGGNDTNFYTTISGNTLTRGAISGGTAIGVGDSVPSSIIKSLIITGNTIQGWSSTPIITKPPADDGVLIVSGNTILP